MNFDDTVLLLTQTLLHFLWQGAALGIMAAILAPILQRRTHAQTWWVSQLTVFTLMLLCPVVTAVFLLSATGSSDPLPVSPPLSAEDAATPRPLIGDTSGQLTMPLLPALTISERHDLALPPLAVEHENRSPFERMAPVVAALYAAGVGLMLLRLLIGVRGGRRLRGSAQAVVDAALLALIETCARGLRLRRAPVVAFSARVAVATVVGFIRPIVLLPMHIQTGFTPAQIEMLLLHEFAHLRRYDHWVALLQRLGEALLFFHPAVWYVSRQISAAREHCCDDLVIGLGKTPVDYAKTLLHAGEHAALDPNPALAAMHAAKAPSQLRRRIARILRSELPVKAAPSRLTLFLSVALIAGSIVAVAAATQNEIIEPEAETPSPSEAEVDYAEGEPLVPETPIVVAQQTADTEPQPADPALVDEEIRAQVEEQQHSAQAEELIRQLRSGDPWVTKIAALEMGKSGNPYFIQFLTSLLSKEEGAPEARAAAAEALGMLGDPRSVPYLVSALRYYNTDSLVIASSAITALVAIKDPAVLKTLQIAVNDAPLKNGAYNALRAIESPESIDLLLERGLSDPESEAPVSLALLITDQQHAELLPLLAAALNGTDPVRAQAALRTLALVRKPEATSAISQALAAQKVIPDDGTVQIFFETGTLDDGKILQALIEMLLEGKLDALGQRGRERLGRQVISSTQLPQEPERQAALYIATGNYHLAPTFGAVAVPPLIRALSYEGDAGGRLQIMAALGTIGDPRAIPALEKEFGASDTRGRGSPGEQAVIAVAAIGTGEAIPALVRALSNPVLETRLAAANALGNFRDPQAVDALILALRQLDSSMREIAARSLGRIQDKRAVPALVTAMKDASDSVRGGAAQALLAIGGDEVLPVFIALLDTAKRGTQEVSTALYVLQHLRDPRAVPALKAFLAKYPEDDVGNETQMARAVLRELEQLPPR